MTGQGSTHITGPGGMSVELDFTTLDPYSFYAPGGQSSLAFTGASGSTLVIGGVVAEGTHKTSNMLGLSMNVHGAAVDPLAVSSGDGTCTITTDTATTTSIAGSFICKGLKVEKGTTVNASGTFSGTLGG